MDKLFGFDKPVDPHDENMALVETVHDNIRLAIVRSILDGEKIPYVIKTRGSNAVSVIMGGPAFGADIFVHKDALEDATAALSIPDEFIEEDEDPEENE